MDSRLVFCVYLGVCECSAFGYVLKVLTARVSPKTQPQVGLWLRRLPSQWLFNSVTHCSEIIVIVCLYMCTHVHLCVCVCVRMHVCIYLCENMCDMNVFASD